MHPSPERSAGSWPLLFLVAGLYDVLLGLAFLAAGTQILEAISMELPPHVSYVHLSAIFILVQGISYLIVWRSPLQNVGLVWVGVLYKASYVGLAAWYLITNQMPSMFFVPWAVADAAFLIVFLRFIQTAGRRSAG